MITRHCWLLLPPRQPYLLVPRGIVLLGAVAGGIVLRSAVGLILRSIMFKEAKPVFTCLEKAPAKSPA